MWRQGDVFIAAVKAIPKDASARQTLILAEGEITGHAHRVRDSGSAVVYVNSDGMFLDVPGSGATVVHEEHGEILLPEGRYRVWRQREYSPEAIRVVRD